MSGQRNREVEEEWPGNKLITIQFHTILVSDARIEQIIRALKGELRRFDLVFTSYKIEKE